MRRKGVGGLALQDIVTIRLFTVTSVLMGEEMWHRWLITPLEMCFRWELTDSPGQITPRVFTELLEAKVKPSKDNIVLVVQDLRWFLGLLHLFQYYLNWKAGRKLFSTPHAWTLVNSLGSCGLMDRHTLTFKTHIQKFKNITAQRTLRVQTTMFCLYLNSSGQKHKNNQLIEYSWVNNMSVGTAPTQIIIGQWFWWGLK